MKFSGILGIAGAVITGLGAVFHLQGQSVVGPESSFMYSNPEWITYGIAIMVAGIVVIGASVGIRVLKN